MMTRLCKDCRHSAYQRAIVLLGVSWARHSLGEEMACMHDQAGPMSAVTGIRVYSACASMRSGSMPCGPDAVLWEAVDDAQDS